MEQIIRKFAEHYKKVDRAYGKYPMYKFNDKFFAFGKEKDILVERFDEWNPKIPPFGIENFLHKTEDGTECLVFHISWYETIKEIIPFWLIDSEEVHYNTFTLK